MLPVILGISPDDLIYKIFRGIMEDSYMRGSETKGGSLTFSIIRRTSFSHQIGDDPMQACIRMLRDGYIEYMIGCEEVEYKLSREAFDRNKTEDFTPKDTARPYCHFFTKFHSDPSVEGNVDPSVQFYPWKKQLFFNQFNTEQSGFYGCYTGQGVQPWKWRHSGWTLFYSKPEQNLDGNKNNKRTSQPAASDPAQAAPAQSSSLRGSLRRRGPELPNQKTEL